MLDHANSTWTEDQVQQLTKMWNAGRSAGEIAKAFGGGVTRNAVISKVHRLKLAPRGPVVRRVARPHGNLNQPKVQAIVANAAARQMFKAMPIDDETDVGVDVSKRVGLLDLTNHTCRWPVGADTGSKQMFCGCYASVEAGPYCSVHSARAGIGYGRGPRP